MTEENESKPGIRERIKEKVQDYQQKREENRQSDIESRQERLVKLREKAASYEQENADRKEESTLKKTIAKERLEASPIYPLIRPFTKFDSRKFVNATVKEFQGIEGRQRQTKSYNQRKQRPTRNRPSVARYPQGYKPQYLEDFSTVMTPPYNPVERNLEAQIFGSPMSKKQRKMLGV